MARLPRTHSRVRGFTLIELLVAMAIFAVIGALALGGLNAIITQQTLARAEMAELGRLQRAVRLITGDFAQLNPRYVRDVLGSDKKAPLLADGLGDYLVTLTRGGWRNPAELPRGTLQRVQYRWEDGELIREYWPVLDHPLGMEPRSELLLEEVDRLEIWFLDQNSEWQNRWPPLRLTESPAADRPRAVRIEIEHAKWGEIQRLVELIP